MKAETPKQVLIAARWILDQVGWCQFSYAKYKGNHLFVSDKGVVEFGIGGRQNVDCVCATGAIRLVEADDEVKASAKAALSTKIGVHISFWNDNPTRTKEPVLADFDATIAELE